MNKTEKIRLVAGTIILIAALGMVLFGLIGLQKTQLEAEVLQEVLKQYCELKTTEKAVPTYEIMGNGTINIYCFKPKEPQQ